MSALDRVPDEVPIADAAEQPRSSPDSPEDDECGGQPAGLPPDASAGDWKEQQTSVVIDDELRCRCAMTAVS